MNLTTMSSPYHIDELNDTTVRVYINKEFLTFTYKTDNWIHNKLINSNCPISLLVLRLDSISIWGSSDKDTGNELSWELPIELRPIIEKYLKKWCVI